MSAATMATLLAVCGASCTLDLDRLRVGAGADGGARDAGRADAGDAGDVRDAAIPPDAGCSCGSGWQPSNFDVGGTGVGALDAVDLDGDGDDDVVASLIGDSIGAVILRMQATGCFQAGLSVLGGTQRVVGTSPDTRVAVLRWNDDAFLDIAAPNPRAGSIEIHAGFVSGTSYSLNRVMAQDLSVEDNAALAFAVDLDGRGERDDLIALGAVDRGTVRAGGEMASAFRIGSPARGVAFAPPDAVGAVGALAAGRAGVMLLRYVASSATLTVGGTLPGVASSDIVDVLFVDLEGDGSLELVAADRGAEVLLIYRSGDGGVSWGTPVAVSAGIVDAIAWGVFEPGALPQLVTLVSARSSIDFYQWSGTALSSTASITSSAPTALALGDVDGDARLDIVVGSSNIGAGRVTVYRRVCAGAGP